MSSISAEDVLKVAKLARLNIPKEKISTYTAQLESILRYVSQLQDVDTTNVPPTTRAVEIPNVTREDSVSKTTIRDKILDQAPERKESFYSVPKIMQD